MSDTEDVLPAGASFGGYEIVRVLGKGAFGVVYEALRQPLGKRVALKVLHPSLVSHAEVVQRFLREAQTTAQIQHPHIVETFDVGEVRGSPYLAMEFLEGEPLSRRLKRDKRLSLEVACDVMLAVLSAMATVHAAGVIHRDLKPDNIFLVRTRGGLVRPKVLDFGVAKVSGAADLALTRTSALLGTPYYMSPEQARESKHIDARSDQWAVAVILYECVVGRRPFGGGSLLELLSAISTAEYPAPTKVLPELPAAFEAVIARALRLDPADRFADVRAMGAALLPFASASARAVWAEDFTSDRPSMVPVSELSDTMEMPADLSAVLAGTEETEAATPSMRRNSAPIIAATQLAPPPPAAVSGGTLTLAGRQGVTAVPPSEAPPRRGVFVAAALGAVGLLAVGGWFAGRSRPPVAAAARPVVSATFRVALRALPATATIALDERSPVVGALSQELPLDGRLHRVVVTAPGHRAAEFTFRDHFEVPEVALVREEPAPAAPPVPSAAPSAPPAADTVAARPAPAPAADRPRRGRPERGARVAPAAPGGAPPETGSNGVAIR